MLLIFPTNREPSDTSTSRCFTQYSKVETYTSNEITLSKPDPPRKTLFGNINLPLFELHYLKKIDFGVVLFFKKKKKKNV